MIFTMYCIYRNKNEQITIIRNKSLTNKKNFYSENDDDDVSLDF